MIERANRGTVVCDERFEVGGLRCRRNRSVSSAKLTLGHTMWVIPPLVTVGACCSVLILMYIVLAPA